MTPKQQRIYNHLVESGKMKLLERLGMEILPTSSAMSQAVQNRVNQWIQEFQHAAPRVVIREPQTPRLFWTAMEIQQWIKITKFEL